MHALSPHISAITDFFFLPVNLQTIKASWQHLSQSWRWPVLTDTCKNTQKNPGVVPSAVTPSWTIPLWWDRVSLWKIKRLPCCLSQWLHCPWRWAEKKWPPVCAIKQIETAAPTESSVFPDGLSSIVQSKKESHVHFRLEFENLTLSWGMLLMRLVS